MSGCTATWPSRGCVGDETRHWRTSFLTEQLVDAYKSSSFQPPPRPSPVTCVSRREGEREHTEERERRRKDGGDNEGEAMTRMRRGINARINMRKRKGKR